MNEQIPYIPRLPSPSALISQKSHFLLGYEEFLDALWEGELK
jgi:hypothetical protein